MNTKSLTQHEYHAHFATYGKFVEKEINEDSTNKEVCNYAIEEINYAAMNLQCFLEDADEEENNAYYMKVLKNGLLALKRLENNL
tara:strand:- start:3628 stop:3882 length:255 start_codon:yes stop_codon:yes gene_type:complete